MRTFGWLVLTLVFVDELLAIAAAVVWGRHVQGWPLGLLGGAVVVAVWFCFASPKAPWGGPVIRPVVKVLVFGLASAGLWVAGHEALAIAFLAFSVVINGLALLPGVRALVEDLEVTRRRAPAPPRPRPGRTS